MGSFLVMNSKRKGRSSSKGHKGRGEVSSLVCGATQGHRFQKDKNGGTRGTKQETLLGEHLLGCTNGDQANVCGQTQRTANIGSQKGGEEKVKAQFLQIY